MRYSDVGKRKSVVDLEAMARAYVENNYQYKVRPKSITEQPEPQPASQPKTRKGKREQCEPAKDFEQYMRRVIGDTQQRIDDNDLSLSESYIIETKAILLDEFCQYLTDCGLDHDGLNYNDHLCITHSVLRLRREISGLKRTLKAYRSAASDLHEREKERKAREEEQARQAAEQQKKEDKETMEQLIGRLNNP